ncbi:MAG: ATP synthase F1 subunit epsilon [Actinobacteria bacterium]|nr:ATP synthase F1 subunit epsilon [Actinomycetota bacterium]
MTLQVEVVSPERVLYSGEADMVIARTVSGGEIAFLTGHAPFVGALAVGKVRVRPSGGSDELIAVHGGFVEVKDDQVSILSDVAELADQIDVNRAREARQRAEEQLRAAGDDEAREEAEAARRRADLRLEVASG